MRSPNTDSLATSISRWRTARRIVLGSIVLAGVMATSAAVVHRYGGTHCRMAKQHRIVVEKADSNFYTYSGIGAVIQARGDVVVVRQVMPGAPADGEIREGARLISVDGTYPDSVEAWADALRGPAGTSVTVEVAYRCSGHKFVTMERQLIKVAKR